MTYFSRQKTIFGILKARTHGGKVRKFIALTLAVLTLVGCADPESSIVQNANPAKEESPVDPSCQSVT